MTKYDTVSKVIENIDISALASSKSYMLSDDFSGYNMISVHAIFSGLTGTLDGAVKLMQSNIETAEANYVDIPTITDDLDAQDGAFLLETAEFAGKKIAINIAKGGITAGTISFYLIAKKK